MPTEIFAPLLGLSIPDNVPVRFTREFAVNDSEIGVFTIRANFPEPIGGHQIELELMTQEQVDQFWEFYEKIKGAWKSFWIPSYNQDMILVDPLIADDQTDLLIRSFGYTANMFPDGARKHLAFITKADTFLKRDVIASIDNGDGTETITLNEPLGVEFRQRDGKLISFLWYCRLADDTVELTWPDTDGGHISLSLLETKGAPSGGSGGTPNPIPNCPFRDVTNFITGLHSGDFIVSPWSVNEVGASGFTNWQYVHDKDLSSSGDTLALTPGNFRLRLLSAGAFVPLGATSTLSRPVPDFIPSKDYIQREIFDTGEDFGNANGVVEDKLVTADGSGVIQVELVHTNNNNGIIMGYAKWYHKVYIVDPDLPECEETFV